MTPDVIHFIYPVTDRTRAWSAVNHLSVLLARKIQNPDQILIWTNVDDKDLQKTAEEAKAEIVKTKLPTELGGTEIKWPQYISDVMRLQILEEHGGIYMDTDILLLKPVNDLLTDKLVISFETATLQSICNAFMAAPAGSPFISEWLKLMPGALRSEIWAYGGVVAPIILAGQEELTQHRTLLPYDSFCALDLSKPWLFNPDLKEAAKYMTKKSYGIHVFETFWRKEMQGDFLQKDNLLSELNREATT